MDNNSYNSDLSQFKKHLLNKFSHEFNTPLNIIFNSLVFLENKCMDEDSLNYIDTIKTQTTIIKQLIYNLNTINASKDNIINFKHFNLKDLIDNLKKDIKNKYSLKNLKSYIEIYENVPLNLIGDYEKIYKILYNIIDNSFKFTNEGFVSLLVKLIDEKEEFVKLKFVVEDSGKGISNINLDKIYDAFYQEDMTLERNYEGLGIGLNVVNNLVSILEGSLNIESTENQGTKMTVILNLRIKDMDFGDLIKEPKLIENSNFFIINNKIMTNELINEFSKELNLNNYNYLSFSSFLESNITINHNYSMGFIDYDVLEKTPFKIINKFIDYLSKYDISLYLLSSKHIEKSHLLPIKYSNYILTPLNKSILYNSILESISIKNPKLLEQKSKELKEKKSKTIYHKKVLLIDDSKINLLISKEILLDLGFYVDDFNDSIRAFEYLKSNNDYDLVITDIEMPQLNGYNLALKIKNDLNIDIPVIALSAEDKIDNLDKYNLKSHIKKPIDKLDALNKLSVFFDDIDNIKNENLILDSEFKINRNDKKDFKNIKSINIDNALKNLNNNSKLLRKTLIDFYDNYKNFYNVFFSLNKDDQYRYIHTLKGLSGTLSNIDLFNLLKEFEIKSKKEDIKKDDEILNKINFNLNVFIEEIKYLKSKKYEENKNNFNLKVCKKLFSYLDFELSKFNPVETKLTLKEINKYNYPNNINVELDYLKKSLKQYDFKNSQKYSKNILQILNKVGETNE